MRFIPALAVLFCCSSAIAASNCHVDNYRFVFGQDTQASMTAKAGASCSSHINDFAGIVSSEIAQQATNGSASVPDKHHWAYKSRPGYSGPDAFVVLIDGSGGTNRTGRVVSGSTRINVSVNVVP